MIGRELLNEMRFVSNEIEKIKQWEATLVEIDKQGNTIPVKDPFGPATYVTEEIKKIGEDAAKIKVKYDGMDELKDMLDDKLFSIRGVLSDIKSNTYKGHDRNW